MIEKCVAEICSKHCKLTTFKADCPRGKWTPDANGDSLMPQFGKGRECPLMQFKDIQKMEGGAVDGMTVEDTWEICKSCRHAQKEADGEIISFYNAEAFTQYCIDCPVLEMRISIEEPETKSGRS